MDEFLGWLLGNRAYLDLLFIGLVMTLFIIANILEQPEDPPAPLQDPMSTGFTDGKDR